MSEQSHLNAIVTAGATREPIDDVRVVTNISSGRLGLAIARELATRGIKTTCICPNTAWELGGGEPGMSHIPMTDTAALERALNTSTPPDIVFHSAAVSDFRPKKISGKIDSRSGMPDIEWEKTPKILGTLRERYGKQSFLVGFKLLSNVSQRELEERAFEQTRRDRLNLTVANRLEDLRDGSHPVTVVTQEGGALRFAGSREEVARQLVRFVIKRADVHWYRTERSEEMLQAEPEAREGFERLLRFAQMSRLLFDASGNVSVRAGEGVMITPRQVDKAVVSPEQFCVANVHHGRREVLFSGPPEAVSSIDTAVSDAVYRQYPHVEALLHFHRPWGATDFKTAFAYPCGAAEEAEEILRAINRPVAGRPFAVEMIHHGFLLGLRFEDIRRLEGQWEEVLNEYLGHMEEIDQRVRQVVEREDGLEYENALDRRWLRPVFAGADIVGVVRDNGRDASVFLAEAARGQGVSRAIVTQLIDRQLPVVTIDDCKVVDFYRHMGFSEQFHEASGLHTFYPPEKPPAALDI